MKIQNVATDKVIPYARNPRRNQGVIAKVAGSIKEFGWQQPIVVDNEMVVIAGHTRLAAAQSLNMTEVPIVIAGDLTPSQVKAYRLADNRIGQEAEWDDDLLTLELKDLLGEEYDLDLTGFDDNELKNLFLPTEEGKTDEEAEWEGMPEFVQDDQSSFRHIIVHFENDDDAEDFATLIGQSITNKTNSIWHPVQVNMDSEGKRYEPEE
jgi:ParB-like chromosome segregation protein Spo0J